MNPKNGLTARDEIHAVERALREIWDPIGGGQMPDLPADEYQSYAPRVVSLFQAGASDREVATYLAEVEGEQMRLKARPINVLERIASQVRAATSWDTRAT